MSTSGPFFLGRDFLDPATVLGEILFGLIMTLTFTLGAELVIGPEGSEGARQLLVAIVGCNIAWGVIDGALYLIGQLFERGRLGRIGAAVRKAPDDTTALTVIATELDGLLGGVVGHAERHTLYGHVLRNIRSAPIRRNRVTAADMQGAVASFVLVFCASLPAVVPFLVIDEPQVALRVSNLILLAMLAVTGYRFARFTQLNPWIVALSVMGGGVLLVAVAIMLGG
jgi:hypothetical protein